MKRVIMALAFVISVAGAAFTPSGSTESTFESITLYRPVATCPTVQCNDEATTYSCTDLRKTCNGASYTGTLKRDIP